MISMADFLLVGIVLFISVFLMIGGLAQGLYGWAFVGFIGTVFGFHMLRGFIKHVRKYKK